MGRAPDLVLLTIKACSFDMRSILQAAASLLTASRPPTWYWYMGVMPSDKVITVSS